MKRNPRVEALIDMLTDEAETVGAALAKLRHTDGSRPTPLESIAIMQYALIHADREAPDAPPDAPTADGSDSGTR